MQYLQQTIRSIRNSANQNYQVIVASLVPGSGTTTLLLNDTHPKVCRPVFVPRIRVNTFLSMASSIEPVPTAWLASMAVASRVQFADVPGSYSADNIHHAKVQEGIHARLTGKIEI